MKIKQFEKKIKSKHKDVVVLEVPLVESFSVIAVGQGLFPSVILESDISDKKEQVIFEEFKNFEIWCCESNGDSLRICLLRK